MKGAAMVHPSTCGSQVASVRKPDLYVQGIRLVSTNAVEKINPAGTAYHPRQEQTSGSDGNSNAAKRHCAKIGSLRRIMDVARIANHQQIYNVAHVA